MFGISELVYSSGDLYFNLSPKTKDNLGRTQFGKDFLIVWQTLGRVFDIKNLSESVIEGNFPLLLSFQKSWEALKREYGSEITDIISKEDYKKIEDFYLKTK